MRFLGDVFIRSARRLRAKRDRTDLFRKFLRSAEGPPPVPMTTSSSKTVAIVGGGPVGALAALYFAKHFRYVSLYELRPGNASSLLVLNTNRVDPRIPTNKAALPNKSINLALSDRGIQGIRGISNELADEVVAMTIPMRGRCLHDRAGRQITQFYDAYRRVIR